MLLEECAEAGVVLLGRGDLLEVGVNDGILALDNDGLREELTREKDGNERERTG